MSLAIYDCMLNTLKKKAGGKRTDLEELATDGMIILLNRLQHGTRDTDDYHIKYLPTCCHFVALKLLYDPQRKFDDNVMSLDEYLDRNEWDEE